jgi:hypothetical protein
MLKKIKAEFSKTDWKFFILDELIIKPVIDTTIIIGFIANLIFSPIKYKIFFSLLFALYYTYKKIIAIKSNHEQNMLKIEIIIF